MTGVFGFGVRSGGGGRGGGTADRGVRAPVPVTFCGVRGGAVPVGVAWGVARGVTFMLATTATASTLSPAHMAASRAWGVVRLRAAAFVGTDASAAAAAVDDTRVVGVDMSDALTHMRMRFAGDGLLTAAVGS